MDSPSIPSCERCRYDRLLILAVMVLSFTLNLINNGFSLSLHFDEPKKVRFILSGEQDFRHPLLMLQIVRAINSIMSITDEQKLVVLGRSVIGFAGAMTVLAVYLISKRTLGSRWAIYTAAAVSVSPLMVIHSHYLKEDVLLTSFLMYAVWSLFRFLDHPNCSRAVILGILTGLACATHYKSSLLFWFFLIAPFSLPSENMRACYRWSFLVAGSVLVVFALANWQIFVELDTFLNGVRYEGRHAIEGHDVLVTPWSHWFGFHLVHSLWTGMTTLPLIIGLAGLVLAMLSWRSQSRDVRLLTIFGLLFYLVPELSPLKPFPNFDRYMLPVDPILIYFSGFFFHWGFQSFSNIKPVLQCSLLCSLLFPLVDTLKVVYHLDFDTRQIAADWASQENASVAFDQHSISSFGIEPLDEIDLSELREEGIEFVIVSSFQYERFELGVRLASCTQATREKHKRYEHLFTFPFKEITPEYRSIAFSNPVIRIIDIRGDRP